ncbi:MAG: UDP-N-acetylmuramoyl-tripeptide--D-alanyl-D-alanine ligase [Elusimicrobia bacterium]|nr:UDP-N-acetylmuramoyl-tripeptide--D-alanyl-D-alanine ligase [Elusimicrobiota bacterium]
MMFTIREIMKATGGRLIRGSAKKQVRGVSTDSRTIKAGDLFVALVGEHFDGHRFAREVVQAGAAGILVSRENVDAPADVPLILVADTTRAFGRLAAFHRSRFKIPVVAITGSAGKTSTKELTAAVLGTKYKVLFNKGTENNHVGVPRTLLQMTRRHQAAVIEVGTNHPGEIAWLGEIVRPTVAVFTNIGASHLAGFGDLEGVFAEKSSLLDHLAPKGTVILNADDPFLARIVKMKRPQKILTYGTQKKAGVHVQKIVMDGAGFRVTLKDKKVFFLPSLAQGNVMNALAALSCARILKVPTAKAVKALASSVPPKGRMVVHDLKGVLLIDDTYNANPVSCRNALKALSLIPRRGKAFFVVGDMLELGPEARRWHEEVGEEAARAGVDQVISVGDLARHIGTRARRRKKSLLARHVAGKDEALRILFADVRPGDVVLVKGSRGMRMEEIVEKVLQLGKG